ncbi:MAG: phospholipase D-like domain-containing protein, partial [Polyangiaceae bacterium]
DTDITNALIAQNAAGHEVKVVLNQTFPSGQGNSNSSAYDKLHTADANMVVYAPGSFTYTHEKCVVIDGATAWIMTMNTTYSSPTSNREFLAVDTDADDVAEADAIFQADFASQSITPDGKLLVAPDNDKGRIRALIGTATSTLDLEVEELSDSDVANDLAAAADRGVKIRVVIADDGTPSNAQTNALNELKSHGASIVLTSTPYIHAKAIVVDGVSMYVGSANLTQNSMSYNRELAIVTTSSDAISAVESALDTDFGNGTAQ